MLNMPQSVKYISEDEAQRRMYQVRSYAWWEKPARERGEAYTAKIAQGGLPTFHSPFIIASLIMQRLVRGVEENLGVETRRATVDRSLYKAGYSAVKGIMKMWNLENKKLDCRDVARVFQYHDESLYGLREKITEYKPDDVRLDVVFCPLQVANTARDCEIWNAAPMGEFDALIPDLQWGLGGEKILSNGGNSCQFHAWLGQLRDEGYPATMQLERKVKYADDLYDPHFLDKLAWSGPASFFKPFQVVEQVILDMRKRLENLGDGGVSVFKEILYREASLASRDLVDRRKINSMDCRGMAQITLVNDELMGYQEKVVKSEPKEALVHITFCPLQPGFSADDCERACLALVLKDGLTAGINPTIKWRLNGKTIDAGGQVCPLRFWIE